METQTQQSKALTAKEQAAVAELETFDFNEPISTKDIQIPKLLLMQGLSQFVAKEKAQMGDILDSLTGEVLSSCREAVVKAKDFKPLKFVPLYFNKTWIEFELNGGTRKFKTIMDWTDENDDLPKEEPGIVRDKNINVFVRLQRDLDTPETLPYVLSFRTFSLKAGKNLISHFAKVQQARKYRKDATPFEVLWELGGEKRQNEKGTFYIYNVMPTQEPTSLEQRRICLGWYNTVKKARIAVDQSDLHGEESQGTQASQTVSDTTKF